ncbi:MAG TPA: urate hydroxylase PuuD [Gaiellaceae bacterium]|nr:urate hydroxylase PuuD [Gaiellaceae bacterium]
MEYTTDWLNLLLRWLHVIAGIVWIGTSFYFVFVDNALERPKRREDADAGVGGELWEVHGGGFYRVQKYRVAPPVLPETLHWFKWEAYTTWLSGFALMIVLYYVQADTYLVDREVADLSEGAAIALSVGLLAVAWVVYDVLARALWRQELVLAATIFLFVVASAYVSSQLFSGRAAYLQVGAMVGTMMAGNVLFNIIPAHRKLIAAKEAGREPDPTPGIEAKVRSVHNNYLTLPVVLAMVSNHFPWTYGHARGWLVLVALMVIGAWVRHFFNVRHTGRNVWAIPATAALATVALAVAIAPDDGGGTARGGEVSFAEVERIVEQRCASCHSDNPTATRTAPQGVKFDTPEEIAAQADRIEQQAVDSNAMPPGNVTGMTAEERELLGEWISQGASTER